VVERRAGTAVKEALRRNDRHAIFAAAVEIKLD